MQGTDYTYGIYIFRSNLLIGAMRLNMRRMPANRGRAYDLYRPPRTDGKE